MGKGDDVGRRGFLTGVSAAAGAVAVGSPQRALAREAVGAGPANPPASPLPLTAGAMVGRFRIVRSHPLHLGAAPVVLEAASGDRFQVDVLRRDLAPGHPDGIGNTRTLSVYLANRGDGQTATAEEQGLGAMALADALAESEASPAEGLLTLTQRHERYPGGAYSVPLD